MKHSTFAERLAFARLVRLWETRAYPGNAEIARAVDRTGPWMTKWAASETPPTDYRVHARLAEALNVPERWLIGGEGIPPRPDLWDLWFAEKHADATDGVHGVPWRRGELLPETTTPARKRASGGKGKR